VLAVVIAMAWGISAASWIGVGCYVIAAVAIAKSGSIGAMDARATASIPAVAQ
jgi:hypothetical protein